MPENKEPFRIDLEAMAADRPFIDSLCSATLATSAGLKTSLGIGLNSTPFAGDYGIQAFAVDNGRGGSRVTASLRLDSADMGALLFTAGDARVFAGVGPDFGD